MLDGESMDWRSPGISASSAFLCPEAPQSPHHLCLTDEIQYGQAFLLFAQTQATAQLLQKIVNDSVGRRKRTVLTSGISTPSL